MSRPDGADDWDWTDREREDFFRAIARHRRAAWRITALCMLTTGVLSLVMALLMAPLLFALLGLALDLINLLIPTPDLLATLGALLEPLLDPDSTAVVPTARTAGTLALAVLPGLLLMGLVLHSLRRALGRSPLLDTSIDLGRAPDRANLAEQRLDNSLQEMALAAAIPAPRVQIVAGGANAVVLGLDEAHAGILVGEGLGQALTRDALQGVAAHLVASIADGDVRIGVRASLTLGLFALMTRIGSSLTDPGQLAATRRLIWALVAPTTANLGFILSQLADPFGETDAPPPRSGGDTAGERLTWREWAFMPLMGPLAISGFLGGLVCSFLLGPLIAWAWRRRKLMADATAVRLTRHPDALAEALDRLRARETGFRGAAWASHLCVVDPGAGSDPLRGSFVPIFPSTERRLSGLEKMGASARAQGASGGRVPTAAVVIIGALAAAMLPLLGTALVLLAWVSVALSGLFLLVPTLILHALLR